MLVTMVQDTAQPPRTEGGPTLSIHRAVEESVQESRSAKPCRGPAAQVPVLALALSDALHLERR